MEDSACRELRGCLDDYLAGRSRDVPGVSDWLAAATSPRAEERWWAATTMSTGAAGAEELWATPAVVRRLVELLEDPDPQVAASAALSFWGQEAPEAVPGLLRHVAIRTGPSRAQALLALFSQHSPAAQAERRRLLVEEDPDAIWADSVVQAHRSSPLEPGK